MSTSLASSQNGGCNIDGGYVLNFEGDSGMISPPGIAAPNIQCGIAFYFQKDGDDYLITGINMNAGNVCNLAEFSRYYHVIGLFTGQRHKNGDTLYFGKIIQGRVAQVAFAKELKRLAQFL